MKVVVGSRCFWLGIVIFRLWNALFVRTTFNPDEYWQSAEVAHNIVFGYGYLSWEWQKDARIRGFAHPYLFAVLYKALALLGLDSRWAIAYGPRLLQGCAAAFHDYLIFCLGHVFFDRTTAKWVLFCHLCSWFIFYVLVRPFSNSIETVCTTAALVHWPWSFLLSDKKEVDQAVIITSCRTKALVWAALGVLFRPTNAVLWIYLGGLHLIHSNDRVRLISHFVVPIGTMTLALMLIIDRIGYGVWTFVPWNFIKFNVLEGKDRLYGVHPWNWYFFQGYPAILGTFMPLTVVGYVTAPRSKRQLGGLIVWSLCIYSFGAHKEFRFVLPLLPPALVYAGFCLRNLENGLYIRILHTKQRMLFRIALLLIVVPNTFAALFLSRWHQRAPVEVMDYLADNVQDGTIHFWTPCHATPYYSFLHYNVSMWFPDCAPQNRERLEGCESHQLESDPMKFLSTKYQLPMTTPRNIDHSALRLPDVIVLYSSMWSQVKQLLDNADYTECASFYHSILNDGDDIEASAEMVVCRRVRKN